MTNPWSNVYGLARSVLATSSLLTIVGNDSLTLFSPASIGIVDTRTLGLGLNFFSLLRNHLDLGRFIATIAMLLVISGYRPRFTCLLHWWIAWSLSTAIVPTDGGDQVAAVLSLILVPLALTDPRKWHWDSAPPLDSRQRLVASRVGLSTVLVARLQAVAIYFHAAVGKLAVPEWVNGTAMYYWALDPRVGLPTAWHEHGLVVLRPSLLVAALTWGPVALELALCLVLTMPRDHVLRKPLFYLGLVFHFCNILLFGLVSFFCSMMAVLIMLVRPVEEPFALETLAAPLTRWVRRGLAAAARLRLAR